MTHGLSLRTLTAKPAGDNRLWIAHFGGLFNPVHTGHLAIGRRLLEGYSFDRVIYVPGSRHYPKPDLAPEADRLALLQMSIAGESRFEACEYELGKDDWTEPIETLLYLKSRYEQTAGSARIFTVRGDDWLSQMMTWTELAEHEGLYEFIIVPRAAPDLRDVSIGCEHAALVRRMSHVMELPSPLDVSSSVVREHIREGFTRGLPVPVGVFEQIRRRGLYGADSGDS
jgi:nicotinate-nucleotide adenylyltransferase